MTSPVQGAKRDIFLTQLDIREFQLAKSAIASAWQILCQELGCKPETIDEIYIAGAFGNFIRPETAVKLGLVPQVALDKIHFIGNASLEGARMALLNRKNMNYAQLLAEETRFIELAGRPDFQETYVLNFTL